jgi:hypothetical protein
MRHFKILLVIALTVFALGGGAGFAVQADAAGKSYSNPDGGGVDKPYAADDQAAESQGPDYYDGNNGCGQDKKADLAPDAGGGYDDNNGNCGNKHQLPDDGGGAD